MRRRRLILLVACAAATGSASAPGQALASSFPARTFDLSVLAPPARSASLAAASPSLSANGGYVAFDAPAAGPTAPYASGSVAAGTREIYTVNVVTGVRTLISATPGGQPANGASTAPSVSADGATVAFVSTATNLVPGASAGLANVYVRRPDGRIELVSAALGGAVANGRSDQPAVSADGRFVAFTSDAGNLVRSDRNRSSDVFVRDLSSHRTSLVSATPAGTPGNGWSSNPSISASGRYVSFDSAAVNLAGSRHSRVANVFVRDLARRHTTVVGVTSGGVAQNRSVPAPFRQISSISADGRFVAFDSNATNLVRFDENRRSDVFVRDLRRRTTILISENVSGFEGNSDSFAPTISADGTKVAFESFASNLAPGGGPRENVFVRDLTVGAISVVDVLSNGAAPSRERVAELLQRPALSADGYVGAFESTAANLTGATTAETHVFLRILAPAYASFTRAAPARTRSHRITVTVRADDPTARLFRCRVDTGVPFSCRPGAITFAHLAPGRHTVTIRAGGPGLLFQPVALQAKVTVTR